MVHSARKGFASEGYILLLRVSRCAHCKNHAYIYEVKVKDPLHVKEAETFIKYYAREHLALSCTQKKSHWLEWKDTELTIQFGLLMLLFENHV